MWEVVALGLDDFRALQAADLADGAVDGGDHRARLDVDRPCAGLQLTREKVVEAFIEQRIRLRGLAHVGFEVLHKAADEQILHRPEADSGHPQHNAGQKMLGQQVLHRHEQAIAQRGRAYGAHAGSIKIW